MKAQGKINTHVMFESLLMLLTSKLLHACRSYSLPNLAHCLRQV